MPDWERESASKTTSHAKGEISLASSSAAVQPTEAARASERKDSLPTFCSCQYRCACDLHGESHRCEHERRARWGRAVGLRVLPLAEPTPLRRPGRPRLGAGLLEVGRGELRVIFWPAGQLGGASLATEPRRLAREGLLPARPRVAQRRAVHDVALRVEEGVHCGEFPYTVPLLHPLPSTKNVDDINGSNFGAGCEEVGSPAKGAGGGSRCNHR
mmetsp:Transcript_14640/g.47015  ORF Transcript_14640/g.47015 Transcript_14640/m.47015 type:complete len:214 (-) Transcript_14640:126-767(-)